LKSVLRACKIDMNDRHAAARRILFVDPGGRMHDRGTERILARRARAAAPDRLLQPEPVHLDAAAYRHVVDRYSCVLAQKAGMVLGHGDVLDHLAMTRCARASVSVAAMRSKPCLTSGGSS